MTEIILIKLAMPHTYGDILSDFSKIMRLRNGVSKFNLSQNLFGLSRALLHFFLTIFLVTAVDIRCYAR